MCLCEKREAGGLRSLPKSLLALLMAVALSAATMGSGSALPRTGGDAQSVQETVHVGQIVLRCDPVSGQFAKHPGHRHGTDGDCGHSCCLSSASATLAGAVRLSVPSEIYSAAFSSLNEKVLIGIAIPPLTGPPKLSV